MRRSPCGHYSCDLAQRQLIRSSKEMLALHRVHGYISMIIGETYEEFLAEDAGGLWTVGIVGSAGSADHMVVDGAVLARTPAPAVFSADHGSRSSLRGSLDLPRRHGLNMARLWIFGDSFAADDCPVELPGLDKQWHRLLARGLNLEPVNLAMSGSSLDHLYWTWDRACRSISSGDIVIAVVTDPSRRWLLRDSPSYTSPARLIDGRYSNKFPPMIIQAMHSYFRYLDHSTMEGISLRNWLCAVDRAAVQNVRVLIMPGFTSAGKLIAQNVSQFPSIRFATGDLMSVSLGECVPELGDDILESEFRLNHLSENNHAVLSNKLIEWYRHETPVDLEHGFDRAFIDRDRLESIAKVDN